MQSGRLTKKCFEIMDRAEIRRIAMLGMGLPPKEAYCLDHSGIISWVYSNSKKFADVDITCMEKSKSGKSSFRPGVVTYLVQLQQFILKEGDKPGWPPEGAMIEAVKQAEAELVSEEELTDQENDVTEAAPEEKPAIIKMKKKSLRKKKEAKVAAVDEGNEQEVPLATTSEPVVDDTYLHKQISVITDRMGYVSKALTEIKQKTYERNDELKKRVDKLESKIDQLANAVLFVVNTVCLDDAVVSALKDIPQPKDY